MSRSTPPARSGAPPPPRRRQARRRSIASSRSSSLDRSVSGVGTGGWHLGNHANVVGCDPVLRGGKQPAGGGRGEGDAGREQKALAESGQEAVRLGQQRPGAGNGQRPAEPAAGGEPHAGPPRRTAPAAREPDSRPPG